jgi:hypothetical protein
MMLPAVSGKKLAMKQPVDFYLLPAYRIESYGECAFCCSTNWQSRTTVNLNPIFIEVFIRSSQFFKNFHKRQIQYKTMAVWIDIKG